MDKLGLKIKGEWAVLNDESKISIERTSPIWNDSGTFSYPFTIPYAPNRHIFGLLATPEDNVKIDNINYDFELYSCGILILKGIISIDEDEITDSIPINLMSGTSSFNDKIDNINCNDIPVKDKIVIGKVPLKFWWKIQFYDRYIEGNTDLPTSDFTLMDYNVSIPYPDKKFCNVQIVTSNGNVGKYDRPNSGTCFYLLYFLDCLFSHIGINVLNNSMSKYEDFKRLALFSTKANSTPSEDVYLGSFDELNDGRYKAFHTEGSEGYSFKDGRYIYATNKSFPSTSISDLIESLNNAFGVRFIFNDKENSLNIVLIKDILRDKTITELVCNVISISKTLIRFSGLSLTYGEDDDTTFNYTSKLNTEDFSDLDYIINNKVKSNNITCYISTITGNAYRIKVDEETGESPSLFEVGGYNPYKIGIIDNIEPEELKISFKPVICNDVTPADPRAQTQHEIISAVFVDTESGVETKKSLKYGDGPYPKNEVMNYKSTDWGALQDYDAGFALGIMRGSGSSDNYAIVASPEDVGGNVWVSIAGTTAFTADSIDDYGRSYDYNGVGSGAGDDDINERFSLKLKATKEGKSASNFPDRGLVDVFMSEYLYFLQKRKLITIIAEISLAELFNIEWDKRYKIGNCTGFINKLSFDIDKNGLSEVEIELYMI